MNKFYKVFRFFSAIFLVFLTNLINAQPVINSFNPSSGAVGTSVTITGSGFDATPSNNIVFIGATQATVNTASATALNVTVPVGASFGSISITNLATKLACLSNSYFTPTYTPSKGGFATTDFTAKANFATGSQPRNIVVGDLDGDGKPEIVVSNASGGTGSVSILKNTCTSGTASFATHVDLAAYSGTAFTTLADMDGDGKLDIVVVNTGAGSKQVSIFLNLSTPGTLSFATKFDVSLNASGFGFNCMAVDDLNGDGKLDIVAKCSGSNFFTVVTNTSSSGLLSFSSPVNCTITSNNNYGQLAITDIDGDGKNDLVMLGKSGYSGVTIWLNTTTSGNPISFASPVELATDINPYGMVLADFDGDGKIDILTNQPGYYTITAFRNNSTSGNVSFATSTVYAQMQAYMMFASDVDGDGKPDLIIGCANVSSTGFSVKHNNSASNNFNFSNDVYFTAGNEPYYVAASDLDGDGKPDLIAANNNDNNVSVLMNNPILTWYSTPSGTTTLQNVASWSSKSDGTGINPPDFTDAAATYQLANGSGGNYIVGGFGMTMYGTLNIPTGAKVNINNSLAIVTLKGNLVNNGLISGYGYITMNGSSAQTIAGIGSIPNLTINNTNGVSIASGAGNAQTITGTLTPTAGTLNTNGNLTLQADINGIGSIAQGSGSYLNGNVNIQRYVGSSLQWRMVGFPFTSSTNITASSLSAFYNGSYNGFYYSENGDNGSYGNGGSVNAGWNQFTVGNSITADKGFLLIGGHPNPTVNLSGTLNTGTQNIALSYSGSGKGWNLIANPFPSNIKWSTIRSNNLVNLDNAIYRWDPTIGGYASYVNGVSSGNQSVNIENGASFFVHSTGATSLVINETDKTSNYAVTLMGAQNRGTITTDGANADNTTINAQSIIKLSLSKQGDKYADEVVLRWGGGFAATDNFDGDFDAYDLGRTIGPDLSVIGKDKTVYSIFHGSELKNSNDENRTVQLGIKNISEGTYQINAQILSAIANGNKAYLFDSYNNNYSLIDSGTAYAFVVTAEAASQSSNRFSVVMNYKENNITTSSPITLINNPSNGNEFTLYSHADFNQLQWQVVDNAGRQIQLGAFNNVSKGSVYSIKTDNTSKGNYFIKLIGDGKLIPALKAIKN